MGIEYYSRAASALLYMAYELVCNRRAAHWILFLTVNYNFLVIYGAIMFHAGTLEFHCSYHANEEVN